MDANAAQLDEGIRFPVCNIEALTDAFRQAYLDDIETCYLDIETKFSSFNDYWEPFLGGQGPAPTYLLSASASINEKIKTALQYQLPINADGSITLIARSLAIKGKKAIH